MVGVRVGTSGWNYPHWEGPFYPEGLPATKWFEHYQRHFDTVEINNTFYNLPSRQTAAAWRDQAAEGFLYTVKASRYITHMKKLKDPADTTERLFDRLRILEDTVQVVLFQLPPRWKRNTARLADFLRHLPAQWRYVFEFRDSSWFHDDVYNLLREHNAAFCVFELGELESPLTVTSDTAYIRLHGPAGKYQGSYDRKTLSAWARQCRSWAAEGLDVWVYFDNDDRGYAPRNALTLKEMVAEL